VAPRYLNALPGGVARWLAHPPPTDPDNAPLHRLFMHILCAPAPVALDLPAWAQALGMTPQPLARALFALNREHCVQVDTHAPHCAAPGWTTLAAQLQAMSIRLGRAPLVLADPDGLCVHACHALPGPAQALAAGDTAPLHRVPLFLGERAFHLVSPMALPATDPGWTDIARCLHALA
jgi:hypothetical protein